MNYFTIRYAACVDIYVIALYRGYALPFVVRFVAWSAVTTQ